MNIKNVLGKAQAITGKRGTGKTTKLIELVNKHVKQEGLNYIILTSDRPMADSLERRINSSNDEWHEYKILTLNDFVGTVVPSGIENIDIYIDEINLMEVELLYRLFKKLPPLSRIMAYTYDDPEPIVTNRKEDNEITFLLKVPHVNDMYYALQPDGEVIATELNSFRNCLYEFTQNEIHNHGLDNDYVKQIAIIK
ncbi:hypothetical protein [Liquorilactobacillus mali]|uniref:Uncharacterized protein n=1 Tax=Liquorilactobacillus mali KCTC 3596 = DSM 20444 TaxID=1046596 RepID=A0A0R2EBP2_9LACO|nr:hypothetical protein [Liquorilactobacillus mali]KRN09364.1 hypothetical protein FD00_GL001087 [Liquorilactobacillus mali KCTC 3596 = DSM 20444]